MRWECPVLYPGETSSFPQGDDRDDQSVMDHKQLIIDRRMYPRPPTRQYMNKADTRIPDRITPWKYGVINFCQLQYPVHFALKCGEKGDQNKSI